MMENVQSLTSNEQFLIALEQLRSAIESGRLTVLSGNASSRRLSNPGADAISDLECSLVICASWVLDAQTLGGAALFSTPTDVT